MYDLSLGVCVDDGENVCADDGSLGVCVDDGENVCADAGRMRTWDACADDGRMRAQMTGLPFSMYVHYL